MTKLWKCLRLLFKLILIARMPQKVFIKLSNIAFMDPQEKQKMINKKE